VVARYRREIEALRRANEATARLLQQLMARAIPGATTGDLDSHASAFMRSIGAEPVFHTQNNFPGSINTSVNDEAVHGVPGNRVLQVGDLLSIDCGMGLGGFCGDSTVTLGIGPADKLPEKRRRVMEVAREALRQGVAAARIGNRIGDIGYAIQSYVGGRGLRLLPQYTGHGLGTRLWEDPLVPSVGQRGTGEKLVEGMVITIEPIVVGGSADVIVDADGWTVRTVDGEPVAQFEHTVIVTSRGPRILSLAASAA
jgi:methionyl aminopeptidase